MTLLHYVVFHPSVRPLSDVRQQRFHSNTAHLLWYGLDRNNANIHFSFHLCTFHNIFKKLLPQRYFICQTASISAIIPENAQKSGPRRQKLPGTRGYPSPFGEGRWKSRRPCPRYDVWCCLKIRISTKIVNEIAHNWQKIHYLYSQKMRIYAKIVNGI